MLPPNIISDIISGTSVAMLAVIGRGLLGVRKDFRQFMAEHTWLLATTMWNKDKVLQIMAKMDMPMQDEPPRNLPWRRPDG